MSSLDPAAEGAELPEQKAAKPVPPAVRIAKDFLESPLAVLGLAILSVIILVAVFAPLIAPQNPYDLSEIRLEDSRQPPGSQRMTAPWETDLGLAIDPNVEGLTELTFSEDAPVDSAVLSWTPIDGEDAVSIRLIFNPSLEGVPLEPLRLDDLPRGAELDIGEKHSFRSFWTVEASDLEDFTLSSSRALDRPFELELAIKATEGEALMTYWLGTDGQGRDMLSAIMYGLRTSLAVGVVSCFFAMVIGLSLGMIAAFFGGRIETIIMRIVDLQLSFPTILVALMLLAILGSGVEKGDARADHRAMGVFRANGPIRGAGRTGQGVHGGRAMPCAFQDPRDLPSPAAQLPAADHRCRNGTGGQRNRA